MIAETKSMTYEEFLEIYPQIPAVDVYAPGQSEPQHYRVGDTIDLDSVLKGFTVKVSEVDSETQ